MSEAHAVFSQVAHRDYCWHPRFAEAVRRTLKSKVAKDLASLSKLQAILDALKVQARL